METTFKITGTKKKVIIEEERRTLEDLKAEKEHLNGIIRQYKIKIVGFEERLYKVQGAIDTVEPPIKSVKPML